ncbi:hypothetical protein [Conchiformibius steedae]|uniref:hypothetical protein n=1 Tax=Conchiformibius steedae TaxID=153493 RepID=UPI0015F76283|nr:hypothetical protein [Conchiformibius steedae]
MGQLYRKAAGFSGVCGVLPDGAARLPETDQTDGGIKNVPTCVPKPNPYNPYCPSTGSTVNCPSVPF